MMVTLVVAAVVILSSVIILWPKPIQKPSGGSGNQFVGYATSADRTLIRWFCNKSNPCAYDTSFSVYRNTTGSPEELLATVSPVRDEHTGAVLLDTTDARWPDLYEELRANLTDMAMGVGMRLRVESIADVHAFLENNTTAFGSQQLFNQRYPLALLRGWGYLDTSGTAGTVYTYRVVANFATPKTWGTVVLTAGRSTPLPQVTGVTTVDLDGATPSGAPYLNPKGESWDNTSRNLRFDRRVYISWNASVAGTGAPAAWVTGYDVFREWPKGTLHRLTTGRSIQPVPAYIPINESAANYASSELPYYFVDEVATPGLYYYRVAGRDLLDLAREWPTDQSGFSAPARGVAKDLQPPPSPKNLRATVSPANDSVNLSWQFDTVADLDEFVVLRSFNLSALMNDTSACANPTTCWAEVDHTTKLTWVDSDPTFESERWYRVFAVDTSGNRGLPTQAVRAVLHNGTGPNLTSVRIISKDPLKHVNEGLLVVGPPEVARIQFLCNVSEGGELHLLGDVGGPWNYTSMSDLYSPPTNVRGTCWARGVDIHGNYGPMKGGLVVNFTAPAGTNLDPPRPIITGVSTTPLGGSLQWWYATVQWDGLETLGLEGFNVNVTDLDARTYSNYTVSKELRSWPVFPLIPSHLYSVTVEAVLEAGPPYLGRWNRSTAWIFKAMDKGQRGLTVFDFSSSSGYAAGEGIRLDWPTPTCPSPQVKVNPCPFAVFRSNRSDRDYIQITPVMTAVPHYTDPTAQFGYWYTVVQFDDRTGEPVAYATPKFFAPGPVWSFWSWDSVFLRLPVNPPAGSCSPYGKFNETGPLIFGGGIVVTDIVWSNLDGFDLAGSGRLHLYPNGVDHAYPVTFNHVTVGDPIRNYVCTGVVQLNLDLPILGPLAVTTPGGFTYDIHWIQGNSWYASPNSAFANITIRLPDVVRYATGTVERAFLPLAGVRMSAGGNFSFSFAFPLGYSCDSDGFEFHNEPLPTRIIPTTSLAADRYHVTFGGSCMAHLDRYVPSPSRGWLGRWPFPDPSHGNSNDGFLNATYANTDTGQLLPSGIAGGYKTNATIRWIGSYPFEFNFQVTGGAVLQLSASRISGGELGAGAMAFTYHVDVQGTSTTVLVVSFDKLAIDANGALAGNVSFPNSVSWLRPSSFTIPGGSATWELYAGPVTTGLGAPWTARLLWEPRPGDTVSVGLETPAHLDPGLNLRSPSTALTYDNCAGPLVHFQVRADLYLRHGGVSDRIQAELSGPMSIPIYAYDSTLDRFDAFFLDNRVHDSDIQGTLRLPFPTNVTFRLVDMSIDTQGCFAAGTVPAGERAKTLDYWKLHANISAVEFREDAALPPAGLPPGDPLLSWKRMLWAIGSFDVPHLSPPGSDAVGSVNLEASFRPNGTFNGTRLVYERVDYGFDGFPLLIGNLTFSTVGQVPGWVVNASLVDPPSADWDAEGYVNLSGQLITPYFGAVRGSKETGALPRIIVLGWNDTYVGFDMRPVVWRTWVQWWKVNISYTYDNLTYVHNRTLHRGMFVGIHNYEFLPDFSSSISTPDFLHFFHVDTGVVIEAKSLGVYLGFSSGVAVLRAIAELTQGGLTDTVSDALDAQMRNVWAPRIDMAHVDNYTNLTKDVWSLFHGTRSFTNTTTVISAWVDEGNKLENATDIGGGTKGKLDDWGIQLKEWRGDVILSGAGTDVQFERLHVSMMVDIVLNKSANKTLVHADNLTFEFNRWGEFLLGARDVSSYLLNASLRVDILLDVNVSTYSFEGALTLRNFDFKAIHVNQASAALGVGENMFYLGASLDARLKDSTVNVNLGGSVLFGRISSSSRVLRETFPDVMSKIGEVLTNMSAPPDATLTGFYVRVYGDIPMYDTGSCLLTLSAGAEIAVWYWIDSNDHDNYGGRLRGYVYGTLLCFVSARGDISLEYRVAYDPARQTDVEHFTGTLWVAGGVGWCDPGSWNPWDGHKWWWNDSWCEQAVALIDLEYTNPPPSSGQSQWRTEYWADLE